ncbi:tRNA uracil 4-sulfurtransferase ThiI [Hornefia butyriciproducens]|uniref:tRNA uracil 4-sulfurtransferase ThiI n=1 Tax=Hornefia butyriciproducens TaxID=2652293 RepID=UPI0029F9402B|nr:tRNA uracil 4-sulfurtransferase ThiI [Hornefia butyriciproducens]MCI7413003.1 tRNA 4-thiouridine(8) synthase ThiI [Clostridiales bacterium]MDD7019500.1 tRNA 4-thiouridine(8) synthase ThiI [Hornefia butyriciproducens]MDY5462805.1 tRNA uracil 4-sulfurtransferase ThiI [Hornefia butyriciproducens]MDY6211123.1 tRNA uracil 4-sulfurtransferase ThiI [Hornefia butyriciproducens]
MNEKNIFIVRCGEVALKGMNKPYFEKTLAERIRRNLKDYDGVEVKRHEGLIFVRSPKDLDSEEIIRQVSRVFGVSSISPAVEAPSDLDAIGETAVEFMKQQIRERGIRTFKVEAKRADKTFPVKSPEIARIIGASVLIGCKVLKVDVHEPDCKLFVDLRRDRTYLYDEKIQGFGGLPLGTNGKGLVLLSGGIDSPVAAWMMAKRGMVIEALHFHSYPYTSPRAQQKVEELAGIVASYCGRMKIHVINLLPIQEQIVQNCPEEETTILVRRFMMRIGEKIARRSGCMMLITGENLGQVASQTAEALVVTDACVQMPVMRPLIAMDKVDIMDKAMEIGTYEKSIEPYEDCCTVFLPKHPSTKPRLAQIEASEALLDVEGLVDAAVKSEEIVRIDVG